MSASRRKRGPSLDVLPYRALLRAEEWEDRKRMVMALYDSGRSDASPVLRLALQDPDERVRLLAAQALERISERSEKAIEIERARVKSRPNDPTPRLALAHLLFERAARASHSAETERSAFAEAATHVKAAIEHLKEPRLGAARLELGRIYARLQQPTDAARVLSLVPPDSPSFTQARFLLAEMFLASGDLAACRGEMDALSRLPLKNGVKGAVAFWKEPA